MDPLYQEHILEHYRHPHNKRKMEEFDIRYRGENPSCGDDLTLYIKWQGDALAPEGKRIADVSFSGFGCAISQAGASMLTDLVKGWDGKQVEAFTQEDMYRLYGVDISPQREQCALLALNTLKEAIGV